MSDTGERVGENTDRGWIATNGPTSLIHGQCYDLKAPQNLRSEIAAVCGQVPVGEAED